VITLIFCSYDNLYFIKFILEYCKCYVKNTTFCSSFHYCCNYVQSEGHLQYQMEITMKENFLWGYFNLFITDKYVHY